MRRNSFYAFFISVILMTIPILLSAQRVDAKLPWSVRLVESEIIRCPQSWQLDFQPKLKWDYCHGLELQAMLDVYDTYDDHANIDKMGTFRTYTVKVEGNDITFKDLTIENNAVPLGQAVALHTEGDRLMFVILKQN